MLSAKRAHAGVRLETANLHLVDAQAPAAYHAWYEPCKVALEWLAALMLLLVSLPLLGLMALAAKMSSPGPAIYSQVRLGKHGRPFWIYKIRTMSQNAESSTGAVWCATGDQRVTRVGRFLRETHLDELPQLWNVVQGHMSLIGPRPERPELVARIERALPRYRERLMVRPGLTGLAQVQRPADETLEDVRHKLAYDIYYIRHLSPWLDARIAASTVFHLAGLGLNAFGKLLVKSHGEVAERHLAELPMIDTPQAGAA